MSDYFVHELAEVQSASIGEGSRIWQYCVVLENAVIGKDCNVCAHVLIENDVIVGNGVTIKSGVQLWDGVRIEDDVFVGPNVTFSNDKFPRSKQYPETFLQTVVRKGASIGANATLLPGITIGQNAMVGAGAVVTRDVPPNAIVVGNPAEIRGYTTNETITHAAHVEPGELPVLSVGKARLYQLPVIRDLRGSLSVGEYDKHLPFLPKRYFLVFDVPSKEVRGEHAHKKLHQFLVCVKGACSVVVDDGVNRSEVRLDSPGLGLYIPPMVWGIQYKYTQDAVLMVLASDGYDADDYIRNYEEFVAAVTK